MLLAVRIHDDIKLHDEVNMILGRHWKILSDHNKIITHLLLLRKQASFGTLFAFFICDIFIFYYMYVLYGLYRQMYCILALPLWRIIKVLVLRFWELRRYPIPLKSHDENWMIVYERKPRCI